VALSVANYRLAQSNTDNPSIAAMRNNVTQQRIQPENPQDEISIYRRANNSRGGKLTISEVVLQNYRVIVPIPIV
jgi:hypothetical protein